MDSAPNLGPHTSRLEINKFENCWYKSVRILEVLKLLYQQFLNLSSSQRDMSGPLLGDLSNIRSSGWGVSSVPTTCCLCLLYTLLQTTCQSYITTYQPHYNFYAPSIHWDVNLGGTVESIIHSTCCPQWSWAVVPAWWWSNEVEVAVCPSN